MENEEDVTMLKLKNIKKDYIMTDESVHAIKDLTINFRKNEFVAILGPSGCGKTTLLNIIGGLDRYTSGDLFIEGRSTKQYKDLDWDTYRNHSIGFIFQSYNLIGHISVLANVELALTIAGVKKQERRERALRALEIVGIKDKAKKRPNQLSGGQMQRVAIARALINDPEILLADEPTGALDSETSVQIMELIKEIAKDRLVIMVTHNPELAEEYATRIVTMSDGEVLTDSAPYDGKTQIVTVSKKKEKIEEAPVEIVKKRKTSMSFFTALGLSFNNMMTKKGRTILVSFAGSIGIIGIALIMSVSFGFNNYIESVESDAMSTYPLTVYASSSSSSLLSSISSPRDHDLPQYSEKDEVVENSFMTDLMTAVNEVTENDTRSFKTFLEKPETIEKYSKHWNDIQYTYSQSLEIYKKLDIDTGEITKGIVNLSDLNDAYSYLDQAIEIYRTDDPNWDSIKSAWFKNFVSSNVGGTSIKSTLSTSFKSFKFNSFSELLDNEELLNSQYDILSGHLPKAYDEVVLTINSYNEINDYLLFGTGIKDASYLTSQLIYNQIGQQFEGTSFELPKPSKSPKFKQSFSDLLDLTFSVGLKSQRYQKVEDEMTSLGYRYESIYEDASMKNVIDSSLELKVVGIVRAKPDVSISSIKGAIGYSPDLYSYLINEAINPTEDGVFSEATILKDQIANPDYDVLTGNEFDFGNYLQNNKLSFGYVDEDHPDEIRIYPKNFEGKQAISEMIEEYNASVEVAQKINVSDNIGELFSSFQIIVDAVSYVLIAFVSISLVVSSIMIGIITYVSVLERTREIGVLRSVGARKKDISRVFNAETLITGLTAGLLGVGIALLLDIPIMLIINALAGLNLLITVPWYGALFLPVISVILTLISGLIPASIAANKDPVVALRSE